LPGFTVGIRSRSDTDYAGYLVGSPLSETDERSWHAHGWCEVPQMDLFSYDFILSADGKIVPEDVSPSLKKVSPVPDGFIVQDVAGIRTRIVSRLDGKGYDITKLGPHTVHTGQIVYVNDTALKLAPMNGVHPIEEQSGQRRSPDVQLRIYIDFVDPTLQVQLGEVAKGVSFTGHTAMFGADPLVPSSDNGKPLRFGHGEGVALVWDKANPYGCLPFQKTYRDEAILVHRGDCTFLEKLQRAYEAGASGVVVMGDEDFAINPSAGDEELEAIGDSLQDVVIVVLKQSDGKRVSTMMDVTESQRLGQVMLVLDTGSRTTPFPRREKETKQTAPGDVNRVLYLNGHPLINTRLMV